MADTFSPAKRSEIMRAVRGRNTGPELLVRKLIWAMGFRYRLHASDLPGKPDIVFRKTKKAIFVNGCFWHQHSCHRGSRVPKTSTERWAQKLQRNCQRDAQNQQQLRGMGWKVLTLWECELGDPEKTVKTVRRFLSSPRAGTYN